ncbi:MAG: arginine--tRNA ligase [Gemmatales bacterium]|nr:arginine--tRNA ligase [Gemmatales bacterium]MDW8386686.1 arginine--tRNA ligase [Gemmatales bacterium]
MDLLRLLQERVREALTGLVDDPTPYLEMVKPSRDPRFGDYQANCAMPLSKVLGQKPREVAEQIVARLQVNDMLEPVEIAGPGFINFRFRGDWLAQAVQRTAADPRLGVPTVERPDRTVIDFSSPNVAKPMHVGHLRSTIIGDCLSRLLRFLGHEVITDNHLGDWGTQFGMLIYGFKHFLDEAALQRDPVGEMVRLYVKVRQLTKAADRDEWEEEDNDRYSAEERAAAEKVLEACRQETAKLHAGDPENVALWKKMMPWCLEELERIYRRLDIRFDYTLGESFYNPMLPGVVDSLLAKGIAQISEGAVVIFIEEGQPPAIIRKRDGAFTYTTTDLATIQYRVEHFHANRMLYVVDDSQSLHFRNLFEAARRWGYDQVRFEHVQFGKVLGPDRKKISTRAGGGALLDELLNAAVAQAYKIVVENSPELSPEEQKNVAEVVGIGAVKYADLSQNRTSDYVFNLEKMCATDGNTATYMQYAYARIRSIFRKGEEDPGPYRTSPPLPRLTTAEERNLALALLRYPEALAMSAADLKPNIITAYLWDLANALSGFYQTSPVLKAETPELRRSRLLLCDLCGRILQHGLSLLGIKTIEKM